MKVFDSYSDIKEYSTLQQAKGKKVGFVPTMGALHEGHLSLVKQAQLESDVVIVSIFVNPLQFAPNEDFATYPRLREQDISQLKSLNIDALYTPDQRQIYPEGQEIKITVGELGQRLEGVARPQFFTGVASVVVRLLMQVSPRKVFFGEKDYQQLQVIKKLVRELFLSCEVVAVPTVREANGLAMSSRNLKLSAQDRTKAGEIFVTLTWLRDSIARLQEEANLEDLAASAAQRLMDAGFEKIDYVAMCDNALNEIQEPLKASRILIAAYLSGVRLIDNIKISGCHE